MARENDAMSDEMYCTSPHYICESQIGTQTSFHVNAINPGRPNPLQNVSTWVINTAYVVSHVAQSPIQIIYMHALITALKILTMDMELGIQCVSKM
jgi:hypothetical protein